MPISSAQKEQQQTAKERSNVYERRLSVSHRAVPRLPAVACLQQTNELSCIKSNRQ